VELVRDGRYRRAIALDARQSGALEVTFPPGGDALRVTVLAPGSPALFGIAEKLRRLFDVDADARTIDAHLGTDPLLADVIRRCPGQRLPGAFDPFELAVRAIVGQQVSVSAATTVTGRIVARFGRDAETPGDDWPARIFPAPATLAGADLAAIGMPGARARAIAELARRVRDGAIALDGSRPPGAVRAALLGVPGIGPWTADYVLARTLGEPDAFLPGDLGVRRALANGGGPVPPAEASARAEAWRPWRAYGMLYLWRSLAGDARSERRTTR